MTTVIPDKSRPEWKQMVLGEIEHEYRNYVLQLKITQLGKSLAKNKITTDQAIDEIRKLCLKYSLAVMSDLKKIFISW